jgi:hypothetical protein
MSKSMSNKLQYSNSSQSPDNTTDVMVRGYMYMGRDLDTDTPRYERAHNTLQAVQRSSLWSPLRYIMRSHVCDRRQGATCIHVYDSTIEEQAIHVSTCIRAVQ